MKIVVKVIVEFVVIAKVFPVSLRCSSHFLFSIQSLHTNSFAIIFAAHTASQTKMTMQIKAVIIVMRL